MERYRWLVFGWVGISLALVGCVRQAYLFQTPYDRTLERALRRSSVGWVAHGQDTFGTASPYLLPGQAVRVVIEGPHFLEENSERWSIIRVDTFRIYSDSLAYLPWAGSFKVGGLALDSAQRLVENLARNLYKEPVVRLYPLYPVYLFGAAQQTGILFFDTPHIRLIDLMNAIGTVRREANWREVKILRGPMNNPSCIILLDLRKWPDINRNIVIKPFDVIYVPQRKVLMVIENIQILAISLSILQILNFLLLIRFRFSR